MKILHLLADWKWTGPAEPVLLLAGAQQKQGHEVIFAVKRPPEDTEETESIVRFAEERRVRIDTTLVWDRRTKPDNLFGLPGIVRDARRLSALMDQFGADVVNAHSDHDHIVAAWARSASSKRPVLVRTDHKRDSFSGGLPNRFLLSRWTDGVITFSRNAARRIVRTFRFPEQRLLAVDPALDLDRWLADGSNKDMRGVFGIEPDALVIGMVARFQRYRKTDRVIGAFARLVDRHPRVRLLLLGRSSQMEESVHLPARALGVDDRIICPGYIREGYRDALEAMDIFVFMVPGSDGTARALRETMALGLPIVAADIGMIGEIIEDGVTGIVVEPTEDAIEAALDLLLSDPNRSKRLGEQARDAARRRFDVTVQAGIVERFYQYLLENINR